VTSTAGMPEWWTRLESETAKDAGQQSNILLSFMGYFWWLILGGMGQILFGGMYLGSKQAAQLSLSNASLQLIYVLSGILMVELALGLLKLRYWVFYGAILLSIVLLGISITELVHWISGRPVTVETGCFTILTIVLMLYNFVFLLQPGVAKTLRESRSLRKGQFSPDLVILCVILTLPALAGALLVNWVNPHLSDLNLAFVYFGGGVLLIFMAYGALAKQAWSWVVSWVWVAILASLAVDVIVKRATGDAVNTQGLISSIACLLFMASAVYYLLRSDVRAAYIHWRPQNPLFSPLFLIAGVALAVFALVLYLIPGVVGTQAVSYTVAGLAIGVVVGMLPNADPITKVMGFTLGLFLADTTYLVRGGLLPYTKASSVVVVPLMLLVITGITALFRSTAWFVSMLLGAGTLYALVEIEFQAAPSAYLVTSSLALLSILLSFGIGYMVSVLLGLTLTPPSAAAADSDAQTQPTEPTTAKLRSVSSAAAPDATADPHPTVEHPAVGGTSSADSGKVEA
jgi:hypothetical protein